MAEKETMMNTTEALRSFIGETPTAIYLMSGGVAKGKNVMYKSPSFLDPDITDGKKFGYLGGSLRVHAVAHLHRYFPEAAIVTSSTVKNISHAAVQEQELLAIWKKLGITPPEQLIREERSDSTRTELAELVRLINANSWRGTILALTSDWHLPRTNATLEHLPELIGNTDTSFTYEWEQFQNNSAVNLVVRDAETVLGIVDPKFKKVLDTVFLYEPWKSYRNTRLESEANGVKAIKDRTYNSESVRKNK